MTSEMNTDDWMEYGQFVKLLGHRIFYVDSGELEKPIILLIHGFPTASWDWSKIWDNLRQNYRLIAMDMLGFGFSDKPINHTYSIREQADLVEALIQHLELRDMHVLSHDYGDTVTQELMARQNEQRSVAQWISVCLLNGGLFSETHRARTIQTLLLSPVGFLIARLMPKSGVMRSFTEVFGENTQPSVFEIDNFWNLIQYNNGLKIFHKLITYIPERRQYRERWVNALKESNIPISVINGSADPVSGEHMVARYKEVVGLPQQLVELPNIGHYPQVESAEDVTVHYLQFLQSIQSIN